MIADNELYQSVLKVAKAVVLSNWIRLDYNDLINDAYIKVHDEGKPINLKNISRAIRNIALELRNENSKHNETEVKSTQFLFCKKCNDNKPVAAFGVTVRKKTGKKIFQTYCAECQKTQARERRAAKGIKNKKITDYPDEVLTEKQKQSFYHKLWREKNSDKFINYISEWQSKQREDLGDYYIVRLLKRKIKNPTQSDINEKRNELLKKRGLNNLTTVYFGVNNHLLS